LIIGAACAPRDGGLPKGEGTWTATEPVALGSTTDPVSYEVIDCGSAGNCLALGSFQYNQRDLFGQAWDGTRWRAIPSPAGFEVADVSCVGQSCLAVGDRGAATWDGSTWHAVAAPPKALVAVDCVDTTFCLAVARVDYLDRQAGFRWDGSRWTALPLFPEASVPDPGVILIGMLGGFPSSPGWGDVACTSRQSCVVSGYSGSRIMEWDGVRWVDSGVPNQGLLACVPGGRCLYAQTLGDPGTGPVLRMFEGGRWVPAPLQPRVADVAKGLSCAPDGTCVVTFATETLELDASGGRRVAASPTGPSPTGGASDPRRLACASARQCFIALRPADPYSFPAGSEPRFEGWDGSTWTIVPGESSPRHTRAWLNAVSCVGDAWCLANMNYWRDRTAGSATERWDGRAWTVADSETGAWSLSCSAIDRCLSVSGQRVGSWDGQRWVTDDVDPSEIPARIDDLECNAVLCAIAGYDVSSENTFIPVMSIRTGSQWTKLPVPPLAYGGVSGSCATPTYCVMGSDGNIALWNGTSWRLIRSVDTPVSNSGVVCPAVDWCAAIAFDLSRQHAVVMTWDGSRWASTQLPVTNQYTTYELSCGAVNRCLAVAGTVVVERNGGAWRQITPPAGALINRVSCTGSGCMAVGSSGDEPAAYRWRF
jgi:hypothetical protein